MIYVKLHGRIGNHLFEMAAAATLAARNNDQFCAVCHQDYKIAPPDNCYVWDFVQPYLNNIYRNVTILKKAPSKLITFKQYKFKYTPIPYQEDILLDGGFQSYKFFDERVVKELFAIPKQIKEDILYSYGEIFCKPVISVNVRRGDYCYIPHKFPVCSKSYFKKAMRMFPANSRFVFISDDLLWCKKHFKGKNIYFLENSNPLFDLYAQTLCTDNIMSNSSFSWWGAYLNPNPNKKVIAPKNWFGISKETRIHDTKDLLPPQWIKIHNYMEWRLQIKAWKMYLKEILFSIRDSFLKRKI